MRQAVASALCAVASFFFLSFGNVSLALADGPLDVGGQRAWAHDPGFAAGSFHTFDSFFLAGQAGPAHKIHVFLPRGYATSDQRYPVVYANDGDTAFFNDGALGKSWRLQDGLQRLASRSGVTPPIVVAIVPNVRAREYTHAPVQGQACCGVDEYARYVAGPLKDFFDTQYRTRPEPRSTITLGSSHGGLAAFYTAARYPDRIGGAACLSSSFWVGLDSSLSRFRPFAFNGLRDSLLMDTLDAPLRAAQRRPRVYLDWGLVRSDGFHNAFIEARATVRGREMAALLQGDYGYGASDLSVVEDPRGTHEEESWSRRVEGALAFLLTP